MSGQYKRTINYEKPAIISFWIGVLGLFSIAAYFAAFYPVPPEVAEADDAQKVLEKVIIPFLTAFYLVFKIFGGGYIVPFFGMAFAVVGVNSIKAKYAIFGAFFSLAALLFHLYAAGQPGSGVP